MCEYFRGPIAHSQQLKLSARHLTMNTKLLSGSHDISDAELENIQSERLGSANPQPLPDSESSVTGKLSISKKCAVERLVAVCAVEPATTGSPRKRRRPGLGWNPMERFWRTHLAVTQVCAQTWCELQVAYGFEIPHVLTGQQESPEMKAGADIHLSRELEVQRVVSVPALTREDRQAVSFLNLLSMIPALQAGLRVRELPVFGLLEGVFLMGVIDELCYSERGELVLSELKTRRLHTLPAPAQVKGHSLQVRLYKLLFDSLVRGDLQREHVMSHLHLRPERALGPGVLEHAGKLSLQVSTFGELLDLLILNLTYCELPAVDRLSLEYCHQGTGAPISSQDVPFAEGQLREELRDYLAYWTGHREPRGVDIEEVWKCSSCCYQQHCEWKPGESTATGTTSAYKVTTPPKKTTPS
ncbi:exonuclease V isoform X2 [Conger conger]|uniref:exonuclease V isoform X2 n=1 Tax=Conger conger TaxID=82655 RepID=UPI002A59A4FC|nr:exonuclease V isoform X2 [Conger conger]